jgi:hypothetical protein
LALPIISRLFLFSALRFVKLSISTLFFSKNFQYRVIFLIKLVTKPPNNDKMPMARNGLASIDCGVCGLGVGDGDGEAEGVGEGVGDGSGVGVGVGSGSDGSGKANPANLTL